MKALSEYLGSKINSNLSTKDNPYVTTYSSEGKPEINVKESTTFKQIMKITPSKDSSDGRLTLDIEMAGIELPDENIISGAKNLVAFSEYKRRQGTSSRADGSYELYGISKDEIAGKAMSAIISFHILQGELRSTAKTLEDNLNKHYSRDDVVSRNEEKKYVSGAVETHNKSKETKGVKGKDGEAVSTGDAKRAEKKIEKMKSRTSNIDISLIKKLKSAMDTFPDGEDDD